MTASQEVNRKYNYGMFILITTTESTLCWHSGIYMQREEKAINLLHGLVLYTAGESELLGEIYALTHLDFVITLKNTRLLL